MGYAKKWFRAIGQSIASRDSNARMPAHRPHLPEWAMSEITSGFLDQDKGDFTTKHATVSRAESRRLEFNRKNRGTK